jgi:choline dehydrogenase
MIEGVRVCWQVATSPEVQALVDGIEGMTAEMLADDEAMAETVRATANTTFHPVGTAKMGPAGDPQAVVDQYCRVHGIEKLRVVDASVMPNVPRAHEPDLHHDRGARR